MRFWQKKQPDSGNTKIFLRDEGMVQLCQGLGMPGDLITTEVTYLYVPLCFVQVYTNGELQTSHDLPEDRRLVQWFGERQCGEGKFVQHLAELRDGKRHIDGVDIATIQAAIAVMLARNIVTGEELIAPAFDPMQAVPPLVRIEGAEVIFGGNYGQGEYREQLSRPITNVLALDPGIRAIHAIDQQLQILITNPVMANPAVVFQYATINRYPFIAALLLRYLALRCKQLIGDETLAQTLYEREVFASLQGDIATETRKIIERRQQHDETGGFLDLVIFAGYLPPGIDTTLSQQALENVYQLLRPGGALLLGFPLIDSAKGQVDVKDLMKIVSRVGFDQHKGRIHMGTSNMANPKLPVFSFWVK